MERGLGPATYQSLIISTHMKKTGIVVLGIAVWTLGGGVMAETVINNSTSVTSVTSSSASTGGNAVGSGGSVTTGSASASSHSTTHTDGGGGTVEVHVEAEANGVKKEETVKKDITSGESVSVEVNANADSAANEATTKVKIGGEIFDGTDEASSSAATTSEEASTSVDSEDAVGEEDTGFFTSLVASVSIAVESFWDFFKFW